MTNNPDDFVQELLHTHDEEDSSEPCACCGNTEEDYKESYQQSQEFVDFMVMPSVEGFIDRCDLIPVTMYSALATKVVSEMVGMGSDPEVLKNHLASIIDARAQFEREAAAATAAAEALANAPTGTAH